MYQVGDVLKFSVRDLIPDTFQPEGARYVWEWWDGSVNTTPDPFVYKTLTRGGKLSPFTLDPGWVAIITGTNVAVPGMWSANGYVYACGAGNPSSSNRIVYAIDAISGVLTATGAVVPTYGNANDDTVMAVAATDKFLWVASRRAVFKWNLTSPVVASTSAPLYAYDQSAFFTYPTGGPNTGYPGGPGSLYAGYNTTALGVDDERVYIGWDGSGGVVAAFAYDSTTGAINPASPAWFKGPVNTLWTAAGNGPIYNIQPALDTQSVLVSVKAMGVLDSGGVVELDARTGGLVRVINNDSDGSQSACQIVPSSLFLCGDAGQGIRRFRRSGTDPSVYVPGIPATSVAAHLSYIYCNSTSTPATVSQYYYDTSSNPLVFKCTVVDLQGVYYETFGYLDVNGPPVISSATVSPQESPVPFTVTMSVVAADDDGNPVTYAWKRNGITMGGQTSSTLVDTVTAIGETLYESIVTDSQGGASKLGIQVVGVFNQPPVVSPIAISRDNLRKGNNQEFFMTVSAYDPEGGTPSLAFVWNTPGLTTDAPQQAMQGNQKVSSVRVPIPLTTPNPAGTYPVSVTVTDPQSGATMVSAVAVIVDNIPPAIVSVTASPFPSVVAGNVVVYDVIATDAEGDSITYLWNFPAIGPEPARAIAGKNISYITEPSQSSFSITGTVTVTDAMGSSVVSTIPVVSIT